MPMNIDRESAREQLSNFDLPALFNQLGWDLYSQTLPMRVGEVEYVLTGCAEKRGMVVFYYSSPPENEIPDYATRSKIEREVTKSVHEHLIIHTDHEKTTQIWQWVKREAGRPAQRRELTFDPTRQEGKALIQRLESITFSLEEEEGLTLVDVTSRIRAAFDVEKVTKRFYDYFKKEHDVFLQFLDGIPDEEMQRWYVSVILNRLMFIYFIQKKGFLNDAPDYLQTNLLRSREHGADQYYRTFLCPLFFEGFAKPKNERSREMTRLLGNVPYLNGGIFQKHQIEEHHGERIQIPDAAFERLFTFFERYTWYLDDRPLRKENEINPDVLGYIFEKYINQKQMGAYYTKEDITEYISKNTIIPFLLDTARKNCKIAFEPPADSNSATVWQLLRKQPDRYIYDAVKHGVEHDLPPEIRAGVKHVSKRTEWNKRAPSEYALPTEIWREVVARRERYKEIHAKLSRGEIHEVNDLITYNLNIRQFAQDIIENCEGPDLLRAFWKAIKEVTILDPTCGSGAFLFAALNILEPLYEACLDRMGGFVDELRYAGDTPHPNKYGDFRADLDRIKEHPNPTYFILKSIIINNLYGVDIMEEAIEICKLRLFLKMVAQIEDVNEIEPLPDIDFNIQAGNTLVGYATYDDVNKAVTENRIDFDDTMPDIEEEAEDIECLFNLFHQQQTTSKYDETGPAVKKQLHDKLIALGDKLNTYLGGEHGVNLNDESARKHWRSSHKPFHWFIEFYGILKKGGFDVIIGNPPYVEYRTVKREYTLRDYETEKCGNSYAFVMEKSMNLLTIHGQLGVIIPVSSVCTDGYAPLRSLIRRCGDLAISSYNDRPGKLFNGLEHIRLSIIVWKKRISISGPLFTSRYNKWRTVERPYLFDNLSYVQMTDTLEHCIPKLHSKLESSILQKVLSQTKSLGFYTHKSGGHSICYTRKLSGFVQILDFVPTIYDANRMTREPSELKLVRFQTSEVRDIFLALLNSNLFYWYLTVSSDCRNLNQREVHSIRFDVENASAKIVRQLRNWVVDLMEDFHRHSKLVEMTYPDLGTLVIQCIYPKFSKSIIDKIDCVLAQHYGFTDEELDFIINYDIKYRMGLGSGD